MAKNVRENRVPIMMSDDELRSVDDWRFQNRIATRSDAIRRLCRVGIETNKNLIEWQKKVLKLSSELIEFNKNENEDKLTEIRDIYARKATHESAMLIASILNILSQMADSNKALEAVEVLTGSDFGISALDDHDGVSPDDPSQPSGE